MLAVHSIFESISGEAGGIPQGTWCTFVRLQGCNLVDPDTGEGSCLWCDTATAKMERDAAYHMVPAEIADQCRTRNVLITGGEPLYQRQCVDELIRLLLARKHIVQVETNGSIFPAGLIPGVHWVVDRKCPSSGVSDRMIPTSVLASWVNYYHYHLRAGSVCIKWVIGDQCDLVFALDRINQLMSLHRVVCTQLISPLHGVGEKIHEMVDFIKAENAHLLDSIVFSVQLHKILSMS